MEYIYHNGIAYQKEEDEKLEIKEEEKKQKKAEEQSFALLQLSVCIIIIVLFVCLKFIGGDIYKKVKDFYEYHLNASVIITDEIDNLKESFLEIFSK